MNSWYGNYRNARRGEIGLGTRVSLSLTSAVALVVVLFVATGQERAARAVEPRVMHEPLARVPLRIDRARGFRGNAGRGDFNTNLPVDRMQTMGEPGSAGRAAEQLVSTGSSPRAARVQALEWIEQQGGVVETDTETGGLIVRLDSNPELTDLTPLIALPEITGLLVSTQRELDVSSLVGLSELRTLTLHNCPGLRDVTSLAGLVQLRVLHLQYCPFLSDLSGLAGLENLEELYVSQSGVRDLWPLARLSKLRVLSLYGCQQVTDVSPLAYLYQLEEASFISCTSLDDVSALEGLPHLNVLVTRFAGC